MSESFFERVACTRARDHLLVSCVEPGSEFLEDLMESNVYRRDAKKPE